jgi:Domain of unknown function (DUF4082)/Glycosyl hydrolases family 16/Bacterial Ig domain
MASIATAPRAAFRTGATGGRTTGSTSCSTTPQRKRTGHRSTDDGPFRAPLDASIELLASDLLANDTDPEGGTLTVTSVQDPVHGSVSLDGDSIAFELEQGYTGTEAGFTYTVADAEGATAAARVAIAVDADRWSLFLTPVSPKIAVDPDSNAVELGVRFYATRPGYITGLRFYRGPENEGPNEAHLWRADGTLLATATFPDSGGVGWQEVRLEEAMPIDAYAIYVASYHAPVGHYSADNQFFVGSVVSGPLVASASGGNGVYCYGPPGCFPSETYQRTNYWVDVVFAEPPGAGNPSADDEPPAAPGNFTASAASSTRIDLTWNTASDNVGVAGYEVRRDGTVIASLGGGVTSHGDTGLSPSTDYAYEVMAFDAAGNASEPATATATTLAAAPPPALADGFVPDGYALAWSDEFDSLSLGGPNGGQNWSPYYTGWNVRHLAGNSDDAVKMADYEQLRDGGDTVGDALRQTGLWGSRSGYLHEVAGGQLALRGYPVPSGQQSAFWGFPYVAGMISGQPSFSQRYGYWETRVWPNTVSKGHHLAVWLLPTDNAWPPEIDILEVIGGYPNMLTTNSHGESPDKPITFIYDKGPVDQWWVLGFEWTPTTMRWTINGEVVREHPNYITNRNLYFLITWDIASNWPGDPDASTDWPAEVLVDYVRVYRPAGNS